MKSFKSFLQSSLDEALVIVGGKPYPKSGHAVILAGGAGSGKGFILNKLVAIDGKIFDVDEVKKSILKHSKLRAEFKKDVRKAVKSKKFPELTVMPDIDKEIKDKTLLKKPIMVSLLHLTNKRLGISQKIENAFFKSLDPNDQSNLPNIVFDVTLKEISKLGNVTTKLKQHGYDAKNIHLVWIANDVALAAKQNKERERTVPEDILLDTHRGAAQTMADVLKLGKGITSYMDGDIWIVPNKTAESKRPQNSVFMKDADGKKGNGYFVFFDTYQIKKAGSSIDLSKMIKTINGEKHNLAKEIQKDVPKGSFKI